MNLATVLQILEANRNERGIRNFERMHTGSLKSFGLGLTQVKKIAKQVPKDHALALDLWESEYFDAKMLATMVDEPQKVGREQVEAQVAGLKDWNFSYVYTSNLLPKVPFRKALFLDWKEDGDEVKRRVAWQLLAVMAKSDKKEEEEFFLPFVGHIRKKLPLEENFVRDAMNNALFYIGQRSKALHSACLSAAREIGKVEVDYGDNSCEALDVVKHLSSERIQQKVMR